MMKLASVRIATADVPALAAFYERLTAVTPVGFSEFLELQTSGATLAICSQQSVQAADAGALTAAANHSAVVEFEVDDVDAERARLGAFVTDWVREPTDQPWGNRSMLLRDPDGNLINVYSSMRAAGDR